MGLDIPQQQLDRANLRDALLGDRQPRPRAQPVEVILGAEQREHDHWRHIDRSVDRH